MTAAPAIRLEHLAKHYGRVAALQDVSLETASGETFGFLGPNGAGKTTTIRILLDLVRPSAGQASVFGLNCQTRGLEVRERIGYLPGELRFYGDMTGEAVLDFLGRLSRQPIDKSWRRSLLDRLEVSAIDLRRNLREYSAGMKRKLGIVQAFQSEAQLLILDEPTEGLDPLMQEAFYDLLAEVRRRGWTVFMSSHVLPEVERVCDRIGLLRGGSLVLVSSVDGVRRLAARRVRITFRESVAPPVTWPEGCQPIAVTPHAWELSVHGALAGVLSLVAQLPVLDLDVQQPHLEDVLKQYYKDEKQLEGGP